VVFEYTRAYAEFQRIAFGIIMVLIVLFLRRGLAGTIAYHIQEKKIQQHHKKTDGEENL
jgi:branched-chain amino acid transport system permease protein